MANRLLRSALTGLGRGQRSEGGAPTAPGADAQQAAGAEREESSAIVRSTEGEGVDSDGEAGDVCQVEVLPFGAALATLRPRPGSSRSSRVALWDARRTVEGITRGDPAVEQAHLVHSSLQETAIELHFSSHTEASHCCEQVDGKTVYVSGVPMGLECRLLTAPAEDRTDASAWPPASGARRDVVSRLGPRAAQSLEAAEAAFAASSASKRPDTVVLPALPSHWVGVPEMGIAVQRYTRNHPLRWFVRRMAGGADPVSLHASPATADEVQRAVGAVSAPQRADGSAHGPAGTRAADTASNGGSGDPLELLDELGICPSSGAQRSPHAQGSAALHITVRAQFGALAPLLRLVGRLEGAALAHRDTRLRVHMWPRADGSAFFSPAAIARRRRAAARRTARAEEHEARERRWDERIQRRGEDLRTQAEQVASRVEAVLQNEAMAEAVEGPELSATAHNAAHGARAASAAAGALPKSLAEVGEGAAPAPTAAEESIQEHLRAAEAAAEAGASAGAMQEEEEEEKRGEEKRRTTEKEEDGSSDGSLSDGDGGRGPAAAGASRKRRRANGRDRGRKRRARSGEAAAQPGSESSSDEEYPVDATERARRRRAAQAARGYTHWVSLYRQARRAVRAARLVAARLEGGVCEAAEAAAADCAASKRRAWRRGAKRAGEEAEEALESVVEALTSCEAAVHKGPPLPPPTPPRQGEGPGSGSSHGADAVEVDFEPEEEEEEVAAVAAKADDGDGDGPLQAAAPLASAREAVAVLAAALPDQRREHAAALKDGAAGRRTRTVEAAAAVLADPDAAVAERIGPSLQAAEAWSGSVAEGAEALVVVARALRRWSRAAASIPSLPTAAADARSKDVGAALDSAQASLRSALRPLFPALVAGVSAQCDSLTAAVQAASSAQRWQRLSQCAEAWRTVLEGWHAVAKGTEAVGAVLASLDPPTARSAAIVTAAAKEVPPLADCAHRCGDEAAVAAAVAATDALEACAEDARRVKRAARARMRLSERALALREAAAAGEGRVGQQCESIAVMRTAVQERASARRRRVFDSLRQHYEAALRSHGVEGEGEGEGAVIERVLGDDGSAGVSATGEGAARPLDVCSWVGRAVDDVAEAVASAREVAKEAEAFLSGAGSEKVEEEEEEACAAMTKRVEGTEGALREAQERAQKRVQAMTRRIHEVEQEVEGEARGGVARIEALLDRRAAARGEEAAAKREEEEKRLRAAVLKRASKEAADHEAALRAQLMARRKAAKAQ